MKSELVHACFMRDSPVISVIMPVFNGMPFLEAAVRSILEQTFRDFEFIIINDGSTDNTGAVLEALAARDDRIRLIHQQNRGVSAASNRGIDTARGKYIALMDADDISLPLRFEKQVAVLEKNPHIGVLGTQVKHIDTEGKPYDMEWPLPISPGLTAWQTLFRCSIANPSVLMRRSTLLDVGGYREACGSHSQDYDLWTRLVRKAGLTNLPDTLLYFRRHGENLTILEADQQEEVAINSTYDLHQEYIGNRADRSLAQFVSHQQHASAGWSYRQNHDVIDDLQSIPDYIVALLHSFAKYHDWSPQESRRVKEDAARKLRDISRVIGERDSKLGEWRLKLRAHRIAPHHIPQWIINGVRRRVQRQLF